MSKTVSVVVGGRLDKFDTTDIVFAPRLSLMVRPKPTHAFRAAYNRAYRAPSLLENFLNVTLPAVVPVDPPFYYSQLSLGAADLKMEKQDAFEIGYTGVLRSHATVSATVYNQRISNNIWFLPVSFYGPGAPPPGWPGDPSSVPLLPNVFSFSISDRSATAAWSCAGQFEGAALHSGVLHIPGGPRSGQRNGPSTPDQPAAAPSRRCRSDLQPPSMDRRGRRPLYRPGVLGGCAHAAVLGLYRRLFRRERARELSSAERALGIVAERDQPPRREDQEPRVWRHGATKSQRGCPLAMAAMSASWPGPPW